MKIEILTSDYLLAWYIMFGPCISNEIDKFKKQVYTKYKTEYNKCYSDKDEILKYGKDYIPNNDLVYHIIMESKLFQTIKKETKKLCTLIDNTINKNIKDINIMLKNVIKMPVNDTKIYVIHPKFEIVEYSNELDISIIGIDKYILESFINILIKTIKNQYNLRNSNYENIIDSILELAFINEVSNKIIKNNNYYGKKGLELTKKQIYPYFLMYLGYNNKSDMLTKMVKDKMAFDINDYQINNRLNELDLVQFINYIIKNNRQIISYKNIKKLEIENDLELI